MTDELFWAYYSKKHKDAGDTRVLATSSAPGPGALEDLVRSMYTMRPPSRAPLAVPLPVASFGPPEAGSPWLAVCLVEPVEDEYDASKRRFHRASFYALTHETAARHGVTYATLLATALDHPLPTSSPVPVPVPVPGEPDLARVTRSVLSLGPEWCAATAAALLDGPVTLRAPEHADALARAEILDAVMAMLPYGYRASVLAGTHAEPGPYRTRLAFSLGAEAIQPRSAAARRYRVVLEQLVREHTAPAVCSFLAADTRPRDIDDPTMTAALPDELTELGALWADAHAGRLGAEAARARLDQFAAGATPPPAIVGPLLAAATTPWDSSALDWLDRSWGPWLLPALAAALPAWPLDQTRVVLARPGLAEELVRSGAGFDLLYSAPDEQVTREWYGWLAVAGVPSWAEALGRLIDGSDEVTAGMLKRVTRPGVAGTPDPEALARVLAVAASRARLDAVSRHGWEVLAAVVDHTAARWRLVAELDTVAEHATDPLTDAVRSVAHGRILLTDRLAPESYLAGFLNGLRRLGSAGWPILDPAEAVTAVVERWRCRSDPATWALLLAAADQDREAVAAAVTVVVAQFPEIMAVDGSWDRLEDVVPTLRPVRAAHRLTTVLAVKAPVAEVREACADAVTCGVPLPEVLAELSGWPPAEDPEVLDTVLWAMAGDGGLPAYFEITRLVWADPAGTSHRVWSVGVADQRLAEAAAHIAFARGVHGWPPEGGQDG